MSEKKRTREEIKAEVEASGMGAAVMDVPLNFNDPNAVADSLAKVAAKLLEKRSGDEGEANLGLWLKSESIGFVAALADFQRHDKSIGEMIHASSNAFATLLAMMIGAASAKMPREQALGACGQVVKEMATIVIQTVAANHDAARWRDPRPDEIPGHAGLATHGNNGTKH